MNAHAKRMGRRFDLPGRSLFSRLFAVAEPRQVKRKKRPTTRLVLEVLEDRTLLSATVLGSVFYDFNSNLARDNNEVGLAGITAYLDLNHNQVFDGNVSTINGGVLTSAPLGGFGNAHAALQVANLPNRVTDINVN